MKLRITIEYDTDGATVDDEQTAWYAGTVSFLDLAALVDDDEDITIKFEEV